MQAVALDANRATTHNHTTGDFAVSDEFTRRVNKIGRRKALLFFGKRLLLIATVLYFAIAAYGRFYGATP